MNIIGNKDLCPQLQLASFDKVSSLLFEHRIVIGNGDELVVAKSLGVRDVREVRIAFLAVFANNQRFIEL